MSQQPAPELPPHNLPAEQAVLGSILLDPAHCLELCIESLSMGAEAFYDLRHQTIFNYMVALWNLRQPIDTVNLYQAIKSAGQLDRVGGIVYLSELPDLSPGPGAIESHLGIVKSAYGLRRVIAACATISERARSHTGSPQDLLEDAGQTISDISEVMEAQVEVASASTLVNAAMESAENLISNGGAIRGMTTGFVDLDHVTWGLQPGEMIVIAARPGVGKSSMAMNIAEHVACDLRLPVGVFSLEMTRESLMMRALCSRARINLRSLRNGFCTERERQRMIHAQLDYQRSHLYIDDSSGISIMQLRAKARRLHQRYGLQLIIVDYIQLLTGNSQVDNRQQEVAQISSGIKAMAKDLRVPVIALSQLNRKSEDRGPGAKPRMSELRESGAVEQDADVVLMLYQPQPEEAEDIASVNLLVAKNRSGPTGELSLTFLRGLTRFESAARITAVHQPPQIGDGTHGMTR